MPDVLIFGETTTSPAMRHEVPVSIGDDFVYVERSGTKLVAVASLETPRLGGNGLDVRAFEDFGYDDLLASVSTASRRWSRSPCAPAARPA